MTDPRRRAERKRKDWRPTLVLVLAALAVVHSAIIALWLAPDGPVRDAAGQSRLAFYVDPYFQQTWDVLEPSAQRVDEALWIRARVRVDDETTAETEWIDVTEADLAATRHRPSPDRNRLAARRLATNLNGALFALGDAARQRVGDSYDTDEAESMREVLVREGASPAVADRVVRLDVMATRFASLYLQASEEQRAVQVQYRVGRRTVPPRDGATERITDLDFDVFNTGWRPVWQGSEQEQAAFVTYVEGS